MKIEQILNVRQLFDKYSNENIYDEDGYFKKSIIYFSATLYDDYWFIWEDPETKNLYLQDLSMHYDVPVQDWFSIRKLANYFLDWALWTEKEENFEKEFLVIELQKYKYMTKNGKWLHTGVQ